MPQIIVHTSNNIESENKGKLLKEMRDAIPEILEIDERIGQVILYESSIGE